MFNLTKKSSKSSNSLIDRYLKLRQIGKDLHDKMMKDSELNFEKFVKASARYLGMFEKIKGKETLVFEDESDMDILSDFSIYEHTEDDKNYTELFYELHKSKLNPMELESLEAKLNYFVSLFEIIDINAEKYEITLRDLFYDEEDIVIIDRNYSQTAISGSLMFTRIIPFQDLNMTSGVSFPFLEESKNKVLNDHKLNMKKPSGQGEDARIFKSFYELYRKFGMPVLYKAAQ